MRHLGKTGVRHLGACLRVRAATQCSKKGSEKVLGRVLGEGSQKGSEKGACHGFVRVLTTSERTTPWARALATFV